MSRRDGQTKGRTDDRTDGRREGLAVLYSIDVEGLFHM